ncbi:MAG: hypothetical protein B7Z02_12750 [Rhodobacterales bacterium 32-67-9]|nr:MAG: hypothetical protein B7Z02_12750 [Rhodobacterales bacterium 32-67-9]
MRQTALPRHQTAFSSQSDLRLSVAFLAFWVAVALWQQWGHWAEDLSAVYIAGWLWQNGQPDLIYAAPPAFFGGAAESWTPALEALGIADRTIFPYVYPPLWAVLIAPLTTILGPQGFANAVALIQIPMLAASVLLAARLVKPNGMPLFLWTLIGILVLALSVQSYLALQHNQPTITAGFLILLSFERLGAGRPVAAGAALAFAAAIKLSPAAFALIFLVDRQTRAAASFAIIGGALGLLSILLAGWPAHVDFLTSLDRVAGVAYLIAINVSLKPALLAAGAALGLLPAVDPAIKRFVFGDLPGWIGPALSIAAIALLLGFGRVLAPLDGRLRRGIGVFACSLILALFGPLGWLHYYLLPMLLLPGLPGLLPRGPALALMAPIAVLSLTQAMAFIDFLPWPIANYTWIMCAAWLAVLAGLYAAALRAAP